MDDRRRAVAQRDHLALPARLEARRHHEEVGAGVDPARHRPVEPLDEARPGAGAPRPARGTGPRGTAWPLPWTTSRAPRASSAGAASASEVEALLRVEPADHADDRRRRRRGRTRRASAGRPGRPPCPTGPPREYGAARSASVAGSQTVGVEPVEDADEPVALRAAGRRRGPSRTPGVSASAAKPGETVLTRSARSMPASSRSMPSASRRDDAVARRAGRAGRAALRGVQPW